MTAPLHITCDIHQGLEFKPMVKRSFGFVTSLAFGTLDVAPDMFGTDPLDESVSEAPQKSASGKVKVTRHQSFRMPIVGVLEQVEWSGEHFGPLELVFYVSAANWGKLDLLFRRQHHIEDLIDVVFAVVVYKWDYVQSAYFRRFWTDGGGATAGPKTGDPEVSRCRAKIFSNEESGSAGYRSGSERSDESQTGSRGLHPGGEPDSADRNLEINVSDEPMKVSEGFHLYRVGITLETPDPQIEQGLCIATSRTKTLRFKWCQRNG
jgi:hypothetical protein